MTATSERAEKDDGLKSRSSSSKEKSFQKTSATRRGSVGRPVSTDSRHSSGSLDGVAYESIKRKKRKGAKSVEGHKVTFTVTIAQAIVTGHQSESQIEETGKDGVKKKKRVLDGPRAQTHFHLEYNLLPDDEDPVKTDVVTFGLAAKLYTDKQEAKVLKTWQAGDITWVAWTHCHSITMTEEALLRFFDHQMELRIWDTREKLSTRARFDRPKAFKFPSKHEEDTGLKSIVIKLSDDYEKMQPKKYAGALSRPLPSQVKVTVETDHEAALTEVNAERPEKRDDQKKGHYGDASTKEVRKHSGKQKDRKTSPKVMQPAIADTAEEEPEEGEPIRSFSHLGRMVAPDPPEELKSKSQRPWSREPAKMSDRSQSQLPVQKVSGLSESAIVAQTQNKEAARPAVGSLCTTDTSENSTKSKIRRAEEAAAAAEHYRKYGLCSVPIKMKLLFAGFQSVTERLENSVNALDDLFVSVAVSSPLMPEELHSRWNPLVIKIQSATDMPNTPINYADLRLRCQPAYVKYKFFQQEAHRSVGRPQDRSLYWDDVNVILTGTLNQAEFIEQLRGPHLKIEIHDRDRKMEKPKLLPTLFGDDLQDEKISNVGTVASKRTLYNAFKGREDVWDPYGIAKLDLSGFLLGQKSLHLNIPIHACPPLDPLGTEKSDGKLVGVLGAVDGPEDEPIPDGHYLDNSSMLKVKLDLAYPLTTPFEVAAKELNISTEECPFGRLVFLFAYKNTVFLHKLQNLVMSVNAETLQLGHLPLHVLESALSTYKLSREQQQSSTLDIVTGFHLMDREVHIFVLEGLAGGAIRRLWEELPKEDDISVLYNSSMSFRERLYSILDVDLCHIKLHEPLSVIVQHPLLYVRDMVPQPCFKALTKLQQLVQTEKLRDAVRNDLFPSAEMVLSMSKEFGIPLTKEDFEELQVVPAEAPSMKEKYGEERHTSRVWTPIDHLNYEYAEKMNTRETGGDVRDFEFENMIAVREKSELNKHQRSLTMPLTVKADVPVGHNYSTQTLNSTELGKERLRIHLAETGGGLLHTYGPEFHHSTTFVPVNTTELANQAKADSIASWRTPQGWTYPGKKTMLDSNVHPLKPHPARVDYLKESWQENSLHANVLQPTLQREVFPWIDRKYDYDVWTQPPHLFGKEPATIHLAGEKLKQEKLSAKQEDLNKWKAKVKVEDPRVHLHRCLPATEQKYRGRDSSNQLDRLQGILKDPPQKLSLQKPGFLHEIPPLNVVLNPTVDTVARLKGQQLTSTYSEPPNFGKGFKPGLVPGLSWTLDRNRIPARDYEHQKFAQMKGHDFNVYHKEHNSLYKRLVQPLTGIEFSSPLFRLSKEAICSAPSFSRKMYNLPNLEDIDKIKEARLQAQSSKEAINETLPMKPAVVTY